MYYTINRTINHTIICTINCTINHTINRTIHNIMMSHDNPTMRKPTMRKRWLVFHQVYYLNWNSKSWIFYFIFKNILWWLVCLPVIRRWENQLFHHRWCFIIDGQMYIFAIHSTLYIIHNIMMSHDNPTMRKPTMRKRWLDFH